MIDEELLARRVELRLPLRRQVHVDDGEAVDERDQITIMLVSLKQSWIASYAVRHVLQRRNAVVDVNCLLVRVQERVKVRPANHHQGRMRIIDDAVVLRIVLNLPVIAARCWRKAVPGRTSIPTVNRPSN